MVDPIFIRHVSTMNPRSLIVIPEMTRHIAFVRFLLAVWADIGMESFAGKCAGKRSRVYHKASIYEANLPFIDDFPSYKPP